MAKLRKDGELFTLLRSARQSARYGTTGDPRTYFNVQYATRLYRQDLQLLYRFSALMRRIVDTIADAATSNWMEIGVGDSDNSEIPAALADYWERLNVPYYFNQRDKWARLFGGASIFVGAEDRQELSEPLDMDSIETIHALEVFDCHELQPDPFTPNGCKPEYFTYYPAKFLRSGQSIEYGTRIDGSRVLWQVGEPITRWDEPEVQGAGDSVLQAPYQAFMQYTMGTGSATQMLRKMEFFVHSIDGLGEMVRMGQSGEVTAHLREVYDALEAFGVMLLDGSREDTERNSSTYSGLDGIMGILKDDFTAAANLPYYLLWGTVGQSGLSDSGSAEKDAWNEQVAEHQVRDYEPGLKRLASITFAAEDGPTNGEQPESWRVNFLPLEQMSEGEKAELKLKYSQIDQTNIASGLYSGDEARQRHEGPEFVTSLVLEEREPESEETEEFVFPRELQDAAERKDSNSEEQRNLIEDFDALLKGLEDEQIEQIRLVLQESFDRIEQRIRDNYTEFPPRSALLLPAQQTQFANDIMQFLEFLDPETSEQLRQRYQQVVDEAAEVGLDLSEASLQLMDDDVALARIEPSQLISQVETVNIALQKSQTDFSQRAANTIASTYMLGSPLDDIVNALQAEFDQDVGNKAELMVRTVSNEMANSAAEERYRNSGIEYVQLFAIADERLCAYCAARNYNVYELGTIRLPIHPNCRCSLAPWRDEYVEDGLADPEFYQEDYQRAIANSGVTPNPGVSPSEKWRGQAEPPTPYRTFHGNSNDGDRSDAGKLWGVWFYKRRTPIVVTAPTREKAIALARKRKRRGGEEVKSARQLNEAERKAANSGRWIRTSPSGKPYGRNVPGLGPKKKA